MFEGVGDTRSHGEMSSAVPHAEMLEGDRATREEATLAFVVAHYRQVRGEFEGAKAGWERALEAMARLLGAEHPDTATTRFNLVLMLLQLDPAAATPHLAILARLRERPPDTLSAVERQILTALPGLVD
jgi:hypothetical protein